MDVKKNDDGRMIIRSRWVTVARDFKPRGGERIGKTSARECRRSRPAVRVHAVAEGHVPSQRLHEPHRLGEEIQRGGGLALPAVRLLIVVFYLFHVSSSGGVSEIIFKIFPFYL